MFRIHRDMLSLMESLKNSTEENCSFKALEKSEKTERVLEVIKGNTLVCKYNVQDSVLVLRLFEKIKCLDCSFRTVFYC